jgi:hypothetical protein
LIRDHLLLCTDPSMHASSNLHTFKPLKSGELIRKGRNDTAGYLCNMIVKKPPFCFFPPKWRTPPKRHWSTIDEVQNLETVLDFPEELARMDLDLNVHRNSKRAHGSVEVMHLVGS